MLETPDEAQRNEFTGASGMVGNDQGIRWEVTSAIEEEQGGVCGTSVNGTVLVEQAPPWSASRQRIAELSYRVSFGCGSWQQSPQDLLSF